MADPKPKTDPGPNLGRIIYWSVGQGDFISYIGPDICLIFDVGGSYNIPQQDLIYLRNHCPKHSARLFVSHFDKDHIRNYHSLATYLNITDSYFSHLEPQSKFAIKMLEQLHFLQSKIHVIGRGFKLKTRQLSVTCLWPLTGSKNKTENERSLVLKVTANNNRQFLFTGDLPSKAEKKILQREWGADPRPASLGFLKVGHHGSRSSTSDGFLKNLLPHTCIVSVGKNNTYGHPHKEAIERMINHHCAILRTDVLGDIVVEI